jgi:hypothetical protein
MSNLASRCTFDIGKLRPFVRFWHECVGGRVGVPGISCCSGLFLLPIVLVDGEAGALHR